MKTKKELQAAWKALQIPCAPRSEQIQAINSILDGRDTMVIASTSFGKSAIYEVSALIGAEKGEWTLVVEPTLSLIGDQVQKLQALEIAAEMMTSRNDIDHYSILKDLREGKITLLYVTPERLQNADFCATVEKHPPSLLVVDEAHCVLDWGCTFRSAYLRIGKFIKRLEHRPVITAFTATAPLDYQDEICGLLHMKKPAIYTSSLKRDKLILLKEECLDLSVEARLRRTNYLIKKYREDGRVVVYCATRTNVDTVANYLTEKFPGEVVKCHAYMDTDKREKHEMQFITGSKRIMVATTAFAMGINIPDIRLVLHFNLPLNPIDYYQQVGRAGRDGKKAHAMLFYHPDDIGLNQYILKKGDYPEDVQDWLTERLERMTVIAQSDRCLMQQVLEELGEDHPKTCRHCTNCQRARRLENDLSNK